MTTAKTVPAAVVVVAAATAARWEAASDAKVEEGASVLLLASQLGVPGKSGSSNTGLNLTSSFDDYHTGVWGSLLARVLLPVRTCARAGRWVRWTGCGITLCFCFCLVLSCPCCRPSTRPGGEYFSLNYFFSDLFFLLSFFWGREQVGREHVFNNQI